MVIRSDLLYSKIVGAVSYDADAMGIKATGSRTELDSHANMPVVGANAYVLADSGKNIEVNLYTPDYKAMSVPMVA